MTRQPEYLSFEFHRETMEKDEACFDKLSSLTRFDFVISEPFKFEIGRLGGLRSNVSKHCELQTPRRSATCLLIWIRRIVSHIGNDFSGS